MFPFEWHYHPELELTLIEAGRGTRFVGDVIAPYAEGDLVLLGAELPHTWSSETPGREKDANRALVIQFPAELMRGLQGPEFLAVHDLLARAARGLVFPRGCMRRAELVAVVEQGGVEAFCQLVRVLDRLARVEGARPIASVGQRFTPAQGSRRRHERALVFVADAVERGPVYLRDVARAVHLSPSAFSRFFKRMSGTGFAAHVAALRVAKAARLLVDTDRSTLDIAFECGFGNLANFYRRFREVHRVAPGEYRREFKRR